MPIKKVHVGDLTQKTKCIGGKKVIITYKVTQIKPTYREEEVKREETNEPCTES